MSRNSELPVSTHCCISVCSQRASGTAEDQPEGAGAGRWCGLEQDRRAAGGLLRSWHHQCVQVSHLCCSVPQFVFETEDAIIILYIEYDPCHCYINLKPESLLLYVYTYIMFLHTVNLHKTAKEQRLLLTWDCCVTLQGRLPDGHEAKNRGPHTRGNPQHFPGRNAHAHHYGGFWVGSEKSV